MEERDSARTMGAPPAIQEAQREAIPVIMQLLVRSITPLRFLISRRREYFYDRCGAVLTKDDS